jgi:hypothetical protein
MEERLDARNGSMTPTLRLTAIEFFSMHLLTENLNALKRLIGQTGRFLLVMLWLKIGNIMCKENKIEPFYAGLTINGKYTQGMVYPEYKENGTVQYWMEGVGFVPWANLRRLSE